MIGLSRSAERLRGRGRGGEVDFVLRHVNDLNVVCVYDGGQVHDPVARRRRLEEETPTPAWGTPERHRLPLSLEIRRWREQPRRPRECVSCSGWPRRRCAGRGS